MYIITDDISYSEDFFSKTLTWFENSLKVINENQNQLIDSIFESGKISFANIDGFSNWDSLYITNHSTTSQFDLIIQFLNKYNISENILLLAGSGEKFHGFRDRKWESLSGNLHLTAYINSNLDAKDSSAQMMVLSAVSCIETINETIELKIKPEIKWVNDIILNNSKIGGIITNGQIIGTKLKNILIGIGLNVNSTPKIKCDSVIPDVSSIRDESYDTEINLSKIFNILSDKISKNFLKISEGKFNTLLEKYIENSSIIGKKIKVISDPIDGEGSVQCEGIVDRISDSLEIFLKDRNDPINNGRIISIN